ALAYSNGEVINVEDLGLQPVLAQASENEPAPPDDSLAAGESAPRPRESLAAQVDSHRAAPSVDQGVPTDLPAYLEWLERDAILKALERTHQNRTAAARLLGISFRALRYRMQRLDMQ
ncbi:MAG: helix-turn-helix domain-containing protein, partial [Burkholderiales bacterium]